MTSPAPLAPPRSRPRRGDEERRRSQVRYRRRPEGLWQEARFRFEKAVELDPDNAAALNNLAIALEQQGEFDKARAAYDRALKLKPNDVYIQQNYDLFREADDKRNRKSRRKRQQP